MNQHQKLHFQTRSHATTDTKAKMISQNLAHTSESGVEEDSDPEQVKRNFGHYPKECRESQKRVKDSTYHKENMLLCKQAEKGVQLQAEQSGWLAETDEEIDEQELEAYYSYMAKIQEVPNADSGTDSKLLEQWKTDDNLIVSHCFMKLKQEKCMQDLMYVEALEDEIVELESDKADFSNMYDMLLLRMCVKDGNSRGHQHKGKVKSVLSSSHWPKLKQGSIMAMAKKIVRVGLEEAWEALKGLEASPIGYK
ncbi:hypothetical protein Tco_0271184 [Tanacetum coccineum]